MTAQRMATVAEAMATPVERADEIACLKREIAYRKRVYPRWVSQYRMTEAKAAWEIRCMESALAALEKLPRPGDLLG